MIGRAAQGKFTALVLGRHRLLIAQSDLRSLEAADDVDSKAPPQGGVGWIAAGSDYWPVYALDDELQPSCAPARPRRACALLSRGDKLFGVLCDDLQFLQHAAPTLYPLPAVMALPQTPLRGVVAWGDQRAALTSAEALASHLGAI
ncbi:MAG: hypothetical protein WA210_22750 [Burkholderiaceae bacterium]